jgi:hypothetical protein
VRLTIFRLPDFSFKVYNAKALLYIYSSKTVCMYSKEQTQHLQSETTKLLQQLKDKLNDNAIHVLRDVLRFHEYRYYVLNDPLIADGEYDQLYKALEKIEAAHPDQITPDSPTQRVSKGLIKDFPKVQHLVPMLSLDNSYNAEDLIDFDRKRCAAARRHARRWCYGRRHYYQHPADQVCSPVGKIFCIRHPAN